jgi:hypothetical protein
MCYVISLVRYDFHHDVQDYTSLLGLLLKGITLQRRIKADEKFRVASSHGMSRRSSSYLKVSPQFQRSHSIPVSLSDISRICIKSSINRRPACSDRLTWSDYGQEHDAQHIPTGLEWTRSAVFTARLQGWGTPVLLSLSSAQVSILRSIASSSRRSPVTLTRTGWW